MKDDLIGILSDLLKESEDLDQVLGFVKKDEEGFHIVYQGARYLLTLKERPENDGGMVLYELGEN